MLEWYRDNARVLPWRSDPTPYHVWLSEIMLQQTRVAAVMDYYRRFMAAPTVADLAAVEEDQLMKLWQGLGYYSRARNLQKAARQIDGRTGEFPADYNALRSLAGVGDYTAGAVASIAFRSRSRRWTERAAGGSPHHRGHRGHHKAPDQGGGAPGVIPVDFRGLQPSPDGTGGHGLPPNGAPLCEVPGGLLHRSTRRGRTGRFR